MTPGPRRVPNPDASPDPGAAPATKTILVTGSTAGIGREAAGMLAQGGHRVLLHGRDPSKLADVARELSSSRGGQVESYLADLASLSEVEALAEEVAGRHPDGLDVLVNNAGVYGAPAPRTPDGLDVRFAVNTIAPYLLTRRLLPLLGRSGRVINVASAAQRPVDLEALGGARELADSPAYGQSKLALIMWTRALAGSLGDDGPVIVAVNPGSLLGTKMVRDAFGIPGGDVGIGAEILVRAALEEAFADASGRYFDNDDGRFAEPHPEALDDAKCEAVVEAMEQVLADVLDADPPSR